MAPLQCHVWQPTALTQTLSGRINRRTVLKGAAAGATAPVLAGASTFGYSERASAQDDMANTVVFAVEGSPPTFDPAGAGTDSRVDTPSINLYNALVQHTLGSADIEPELATEWEIERRRTELYLHPPG